MGCPVDPRQSISWYSKAAVQEEHQSELALSGWYLTGSDGVLQQSDTEAYLWARKAAQSGLAKAEYAMGYFTEVVCPDQSFNQISANSAYFELLIGNRSSREPRRRQALVLEKCKPRI